MIDLDKKKIADAVSQFPPEFGLRGFPGERFRVSLRDSYVSDGVVMVYTERDAGGMWLAFAKGTVGELLGQTVADSSMYALLVNVGATRGTVQSLHTSLGDATTAHGTCGDPARACIVALFSARGQASVGVGMRVWLRGDGTLADCHW